MVPAGLSRFEVEGSSSNLDDLFALASRYVDFVHVSIFIIFGKIFVNDSIHYFPF